MIRYNLPMLPTRLLAARPLLATLLIAFALYPLPVRANDSAAEVAAGGILLRREPRILMNKEKLTISRDKVTVEYEFLNESDSDIITEVAFPIPPYEAETDEGYPPHWFEDFHVWVNDQPVHFEIAAKTTLKNVDYTALLKSMDIDLLTFAHFDGEVQRSDLNRLPPDRKSKLLKLGLIDGSSIPLWTLAKTYHWEQSFPAHKAIHIRHEYKPVVGFQGFKTDKLSTELANACIDPGLPAKLSHRIAQNLASGSRVKGDDYLHVQWVKYILTTANSWKTPIKNFELIIDRSDADRSSANQSSTDRSSGNDSRRNFVSLCWDGPIQPIDANRFSAKKSDFVPTKELTVYFLEDF